MSKVVAYCWKSGQIGFGRIVPDGCIAILTDTSMARLKAEIEVTARHDYSGGLLVPGLPEAETNEERFRALGAYMDWLVKRRDRRTAARPAVVATGTGAAVSGCGG